METINKDAKYILIGHTYTDCADIKGLQLLGYAPKDDGNAFSQPDENKPVYRAIFQDGTFMEGIISKDNIDFFNNYNNKDNKIFTENTK